MEPPWEEGTRIYINRLSHMTKMAAMSIYCKTLKNLHQNQNSYDLGIQHRGLELYKVYINNYPGLTLTYFTARSNWVGFVLASVLLLVCTLSSEPVCGF